MYISITNCIFTIRYTIITLKQRKLLFDLGVFDYKIEVILTDDIGASRRKYNKQIGNKYAGDPVSLGGLHSYKGGVLRSFIFLPFDCRAGVIAHEAFHAASRVCKVFDIPLKASTEEVYAYILDYIVDKIHQFKTEPVLDIK